VTAYSKEGWFIKLVRKIKSILSQTSYGANLASWIQKYTFKYLFKNTEELFTYYYRTNKWGNSESLSGPGSSLAATSNLRKILPEIIKDYGVKRILDAPCGDFHWFKVVTIPDEVMYIGGDIVRILVEENNIHFSKTNIKFIHLDILNDEIPTADLWLCRDTLFHFSNADVIKVLDNLKKSEIKYFLSTSYPEVEENTDILTGDFRPINLDLPPFSLPYHLLGYFDDSDEGHIGKKLGLWEIKNAQGETWVKGKA